MRLDDRPSVDAKRKQEASVAGPDQEKSLTVTNSLRGPLTPFLPATFKRANKNGELERYQVDLYSRQYFKSRYSSYKTNGLDFSSPF